MKILLALGLFRITECRLFRTAEGYGYGSSPYSHLQYGEPPYYSPYACGPYEESPEEMLEFLMEDIENNPNPNAFNEMIDAVVKERDEEKKSRVCLIGGQLPNSFAIVFEEGPSVNIASVLSTLDEYKKKCAFYLDPFKITEKNIKLVRLIALKGHLVGVCVLNEKDLNDLPMSGSKQVIQKAYDMFVRKLGFSPLYVVLSRQG